MIETHDETGAGAGAHAELSMVWSEHAVFMVDGEEIDAPAGTLVYVAGTASRRGARATADDTVALVIGAPADGQLPVSPFAYWFVAEGPLRAGDHDEAIRIVEEELQEHPEHPTMLYQLACYHALAGRRDQALRHFERSLAAGPEGAEWQDGDGDLDSIRDHPRFQAALTAARDRT